MLFYQQQQIKSDYRDRLVSNIHLFQTITRIDGSNLRNVSNDSASL